ncbi:MAG: YihY/virulence factor BrkB family protein [Candidatus Cloacimonetes bacterium]|nr:YihY/virulence factor BrkB family protein [Candidatus Cloacimonadota bacterium]MBL7107881.1 YihY/virulence factor BrkB family protein [Candidatus Cloacimonadota bacterium]
MKKLWQNTKTIYSNFIADQCYLRSSSLAYITFLGFIPFLMVILLFTPDITFVRIQETIKNFVFNTFVPESAQAIQSEITKLLERRVGLNVMSFVLLVLTSFFLFKFISQTFDKILGIHKKRDHTVLRDFERFVSMIIGGLIIVAILLFTSSLPMVGRFLKLAFLIKILPYFGIFLVLFVIYKFVVSVHPKTTSVLIAAAFSSILWAILKFGFDSYILTFTNVSSVYGNLGVFPIFMIWLYANWLVILFGMEIVAFHSGNKSKNEKKDEKFTLKLTIEKEIGKEISEEIKELDFANEEIDRKSFLELIKNIFKISEKNEEKKEQDELQKE